MTSTAVSSVMRMEFVNSEAVEVSNVPSWAEWRTIAANSDADLADESSSWGSTPKRRNIPFAEEFRTTITGLKITVKSVLKGTIRPAVFRGWASARFFGTSSPKTIDMTLMMTAATPTPTAEEIAVDSPRPTPALVRRSASADWVVYPKRIVVKVMPTCEPES